MANTIIPIGYKRCTQCREIKSLERYPLLSRANMLKSKSGKYRAYCWDCHYKDHRKNTTNTVVNIIKRKLLACKRHAKDNGYKECTTLLSIIVKAYTEDCNICNMKVGVEIRLDHCHKTGKFRGFLCNRCNLKLGVIEEESEIKSKCIEYLNKHKGN